MTFILKKFIPDLYIKSFRDLDADTLRKKGIKLLICDIDNTLVAHDEAHPNDDVYSFVNKVKKSGLDFCFISNNSKERVELFAKSLKVKTYHFAKKPLKITYRKIMKDYGYKPSEIASIGDQLMTDVLGGKRAKIYCILVNPVVTRDIASTKVNRIFENMVFKQLSRKNILHKGEYDE